MLESLFLQAAGIDQQLIIHTKGHTPTHIICMPYQQLGPTLKDIGIKNRTKYAMSTRVEVIGLEEIDIEATTRVSKKLPQDQRAVLDIIRTGSRWTSTAAYWAGQQEDKVCSVCNDTDEGFDHLWTCKAL